MRRWRSRCAGLASVAPLGTAAERGGTTKPPVVLRNAAAVFHPPIRWRRPTMRGSDSARPIRPSAWLRLTAASLTVRFMRSADFWSKGGSPWSGYARSRARRTRPRDCRAIAGEHRADGAGRRSDLARGQATFILPALPTRRTRANLLVRPIGGAPGDQRRREPPAAARLQPRRPGPCNSVAQA